ncbi:MAG: lytic transglycosylase domain-containing protein, partial [Pseudomonadota bacterium]
MDLRHALKACARSIGAVVCLMTAALSSVAAPANAATPSAPRLKPAAPAPSAYVSEADYRRLQDVRRALIERKFTVARSIARAIDDPVGHSLGQWMVLSARGADPTLQEADAFLALRPDWPLAKLIQRRAERAAPRDLPGGAWLAFFAAREPLTGEGKWGLAKAHMAEGRGAEAAEWLRDGWINHDYKLLDEQRILAQMGALLRPQDHAARIDRLLWNNQRTATRRILDRAPARTQRAAQTRMALLARAQSAPALYNALPEDLKQDGALQYEFIRYLRRKGDRPASRALLRAAPLEHAALGRPDKWWSERRYQAREALKDGYLEDAYAFSAGHGFAEGSSFADGEWFAGWVALRFLNQPGRATAHFEAMTKAVSYPISRARAHYWLARAADAAGWPEALIQYRIAAGFPTTYYGQLAAEALKADVAPPRPSLQLAPTPSAEAEAAFAGRDWVKALHVAGELGDENTYRTFTRYFDDQLQTAEEFNLLAVMGAQYGVMDATVRAGKTAAFRGHTLPGAAYPIAHVPADAPPSVEPALILGLSRQESEFNARAVSRAGARGLMQLMPETARLTARKAGLPYRTAWLLNDPVYNLEVGAAHLGDLMERFGGSYIMTAAAYNAGASRVDRWVRDYGDPRSNGVDPVDWVELVPFTETRNYIQRVLENTQVYRARLGNGSISWRIAEDLSRGGRAGRVGAVSPPSPQIAAAANAARPTRGPLPTFETARAAGVPVATAEARRPQSAAPSPAPSAAAPETKPEPQPAPEPAPTPAPSSRPQPKPLPPVAAPAEPKPAPDQQTESAAQDAQKSASGGAPEGCAVFIPDSTGG